VFAGQCCPYVVHFMTNNNNINTDTQDKAYGAVVLKVTTGVHSVQQAPADS